MIRCDAFRDGVSMGKNVVKTTKKKGGRPTVIDKVVLQKLEDAFALGLSDKEACFKAGISCQTLYNFQKKNDWFVERKEALKNSPVITAKINVVSGLNDGDIDLSKWYLERRCKDEFGKAENTVILSDSMADSIDRMADSIKAYLTAD